MPNIKKGELICSLAGLLHLVADVDMLHTASAHGWIEGHDIPEAEDDISRLDAARITHMFLLKEAGVCDLPDISGASVLRDLYDCRVCVNHIAQVYLRGLIGPCEIEHISEDKFLIFDGKRKLTVSEAQYIYRGAEHIIEQIGFT